MSLNNARKICVPAPGVQEAFDKRFLLFRGVIIIAVLNVLNWGQRDKGPT